MPMKILREESPHFVLQGDRGEFKVHQSKLSPTQIERMRKMCAGGKVQKLDEGGPVNDDTSAIADPGTFGPISVSPDDAAAVLKVPPLPTAPPPGPGARVQAQLPDDLQTLRAPVNKPADAPVEVDLHALPPALLNQGPNALDTSVALRDPTDAQMGAADAQPQGYQAPDSGIVGPGGVMAASKTTADAVTEQGRQAAVAAELLAKKQDQQAQLERATATALQTKYAQDRTRVEQMFNDMMDPKSNIQPDHFWSTRSVGQKVAAGLGMILSGIGSGLTGQPNLAAQFIQRSIDRDIEAQKANLGKQQTALSYYRQLTHDDLAAENMTRSALTNAMAAEVAAQGTRNAGTAAAANANVLSAQLKQQAIQYANQATTQATQSQLQKIQLGREVRNEQLMRQIYGAGGAPDQNVIKEAGARGLIKPVVVDRQGTLAMARSDGDATELNKALPDIHAAQDTLDRMQQLRNKEGPFKLLALSDASDQYTKLRNELAVNVEKGLAGRVSDQTIKNQIANIGGSINEFWHSADPLGPVRELLQAQHRALVNQHSWSREAPNVSASETAPAPAATVAQPPIPGAVHITDGHRGGWLVPGKPLPAGWRRG